MFISRTDSERASGDGDLLSLLLFEPKEDEKFFPTSIRADKKKACTFYLTEMSQHQHRRPAKLYGACTVPTGSESGSLCIRPRVSWDSR